MLPARALALRGWLVLLIVVICPSRAYADARQDAQRQRAQDQANAPRWRETATTAFEIGLANPGTETGRDALRLYFEALGHLHGVDPPPVDMYDQLTEALPKLIAGYCPAGEIPKQPELCGTLYEIQLDARQIKERTGVSKYSETPEGRRSLALHVAESRVAFWHEVGERLCDANSSACPRMLMEFESSIDYFNAAGRSGQAMDVRREILRPRPHWHKRPTVHSVVCNGAKTLHHSLLDFEEAASWYERCPREPSPVWSFGWSTDTEALERAAHLRLLLGDVAAAKRNVEALEEILGTADRPRRARAALDIARYALRAGQMNEAQKWLDEKKSLFESTQDVDVQVLFHAYEARIALEQGHAERVFAEYGAVRRRWNAVPDKNEAIREFGNDIELGVEVLEAVGEAEFYFAERVERAAQAIQIPRYRGPLKEKPLLRYMNERQAWDVKKRQAIERADKAYLQVVQIEPIAPPRWVVAAARRVGHIWAAYAKEGESIPKLTGPMPGHPDITYEELRAAYEGHVGSPPWIDRAREAFKTCVQQAVRAKHFDENARYCEAWLSQHDPKALRAVDELHDTPLRKAIESIRANPVNDER